MPIILRSTGISGFYADLETLGSAGSAAGNVNGYYARFPRGFIVQFGSAVSGTTINAGAGKYYNGSVTFPFSFPTTCLNVYINETNAHGGWPTSPQVAPASAGQATYYGTSFSDITASGFKFTCAAIASIKTWAVASAAMNYIAIGY